MPLVVATYFAVPSGRSLAQAHPKQRRLEAVRPNSDEVRAPLWKQCRWQRSSRATSQASDSADILSKQPEQLSATTVDGGETLTEVAAPGGSGALAVPLSGVVLPEGLDEQEQRKRLWFAAVKPPMYTVALIPVLVSFSQAGSSCRQFSLLGTDASEGMLSA